jgi:hypothetical protein
LNAIKSGLPPFIGFDYFAQPAIIHNTQNGIGIYSELCIFKYKVIYSNLFEIENSRCRGAAKYGYAVKAGQGVYE